MSSKRSSGASGPPINKLRKLGDRQSDGQESGPRQSLLQFKPRTSNDSSQTASKSEQKSSVSDSKRLLMLQEIANLNNFKIADVKPDGNCMYAAVSDQLCAESQIPTLSAADLRKAAVKFLSENSQRIIDIPALLQSHPKYKNWECYLQTHSRDASWGDETMLRSICECMSVSIAVWHENGHVTRLEPGGMTVGQINIGLLGEEHYVSLRKQVHISSSSSGATYSETERNETSNSGDAASSSHEGPPLSQWPKIWNAQQSSHFKRKYIWLDAQDGHLGCLNCKKAGTLGPLQEKGVALSEQWCSYTTSVGSNNGSRETNLSYLRNTIERHSNSQAHCLASKIVESAKSKPVESSLSEMDSIHDKSTESLFRTAYYIAKSNRPFRDYQNLITLQQLNGVNMGIILHSRYTATSIINHLADEMRKSLVKSLIDSGSKLSVLIDESTTVGKESALIVYVKAALAGSDPIFIFLDLIELEAQNSNSVVAALEQCLSSAGFSDDYLKQNWLAIVSDGASVMLGRKAGVVAQLIQKYPKLFAWHCLNHRLELAVGQAVKEVTALNHFKAFVDTVYSLYSQSTKNQRELKAASVELESQILRIGRVLDVRWVSSSFRTVKAIWVSFSALSQHFKQAADDKTRDGVERKKYEGLLARLASVQFVCDLGLMYDSLSELSQLSLELQQRKMTLPRSQMLIQRTIRVLQSFKEHPGEKLAEACKAKEEFLLQGVTLRSNQKLKAINAAQFLQSLVNNMNQRLSTDTESESQLLNDINIMDSTKWPQNPSIRHGEAELRRLCTRFNLDTERAIRGMRDYVDDPTHEPQELRPLLDSIRSIPCSSSECERGFSVMNCIETDVRNSLLISNVSSLMFININGPPIELFNCSSFIKSWKLSHRTATDTQSRKCKAAVHDETRHILWKVLNP